MRALARFGAAYARVAVIVPGARSPSLTNHGERTRFGAARSSARWWPIPAFLQKQLGFSKEDARRTGRALAATLLAQTRLDAAQSLLDLASASAAAGQEAVEYALKVRVDEGLSAVLPKAAPLAPVRFAGALLAVGDRDDLRDRFDDDWFRNPRALFSLRDVDSAPKTLEPPPKSRLPDGSTDGSFYRRSRELTERPSRAVRVSRVLALRLALVAAAAADSGRFEEVLQVDDDCRHRRVAVVAERVPYCEVDREHRLDVTETG